MKTGGLATIKPFTGLVRFFTYPAVAFYIEILTVLVCFQIMKLSVLASFSALAAVSAFAPAPLASRADMSLNAEVSRMEFLAAGGLAAFAALVAPGVAEAMDQENISDPTERWETGSPSAKAVAARMDRFKNARTQMNSNFAPIKRLNLERKSPVERLDINAPNFTAYKQSFPGLFK